VEVFELLGAKNGDPIEWEKKFESALSAFARGELELAEREFRSVLELRKEDGPSRFYLGLIQELRIAPAPAAWTGEVDVNEK